MCINVFPNADQQRGNTTMTDEELKQLVASLAITQKETDKQLK
jgi:hypothetical protein